MQVVQTSFTLHCDAILMHVVKRRLPLSVERETGFEPATTCLEGKSSTPELLPLSPIIEGLV